MSVSALETAPRGAPQLSQAAFERLCKVAEARAGLSIPAHKSSLVALRLGKRLSVLGLTDFDSYADLVETSAAEDEREAMISALTTNVTSFFRERHHFDLLAETVLPPLVAAAATGTRVRIWSAGCSSGQEPYSLAIALLEAGARAETHNIRILATDIDPPILAAAKAGVYPEEQVAEMPDHLVRTHFERTPSKGEFSVGRMPRALVTFRRLNLIERWPVSGPFDVIFCRNVVIYFSAATQGQLWRRFEALLSDGGHLFVGHSERVPPDLDLPLTPAGVTTYRKFTSPA
ncbi:MAG: protein-glutamate O-methyltransferase CheR [Pseudomonadota bacterium]